MTFKLDDYLPYQLSTTSNVVSDVIAGEYKSLFGLKIPEWRVMSVLGTRGASTQRHLVEATLMDKVTVNRAVKNLVDRNLLERSPNTADGRSHHLLLSSVGRDLYGKILPAAQAMDKKIMSVLSADEKAALSAMLEKIKKSADAIAAE
ncbi:winged helix-turn-helix transcriptional regulator [Parasphingorhabdus flavimaris]|uniref:Winged helix-turn-helix transcriptional regulator n=1 Tax=Parasphingorhabdus flavimaris TaxID=266812 RepID=A0ABX2MYU2_9SPHN|nr:MarR family winged helix-turn-helix transcriptional regulator [Parasphingorhabdus flavimaris]NVD26611.1 winged helix-turn-helix transcriptional regulator [Parasphingorhabdus flavimaris]|tara:strand:+ start:19204 stop:19647 length:444 start_codon:yes stop_codon:yes gene_type:complete